MCMTQRTDPVTVVKPIVAYKVLTRRGPSRLSDQWIRTPGIYTGPFSVQKVIRGKWMKAKDEAAGGKAAIDYAPGFHVYRWHADADAALEWENNSHVEKVLIKGRCQRGMDSTLEVEIATAEFIYFAKEGEEL